MAVGLIVFGVLVFAAVVCGRRTRQIERRGSTGAGRAALRAYRVAGDVRALSRGPGAYGRRVVRRSAFRALRRL